MVRLQHCTLCHSVQDTAKDLILESNFFKDKEIILIIHLYRNDDQKKNPLTGKYLLLLNAELSIINASKHNVITRLHFNANTSRMFHLVVIQITQR